MRAGLLSAAMAVNLLLSTLEAPEALSAPIEQGFASKSVRK